MEKTIYASNRLAFDDGAFRFYPNGIEVLKKPLSDLMYLSVEEVAESFPYYSACSFDFEYDKTTTIEDYHCLLLRKMGFKIDPRYSLGSWDGSMPLHFLVGDLLIRIDNYDYSFLEFIERYDLNETVDSIMMFWSGAGDIWNDDGLRYYIPSRENCRHKSPHIHVEYHHSENVSIDIRTGEILAGKMRSKKLKKATERILNNQVELLQFWNDNTDGLNIDINHYLGISPVIEDPYVAKA